MPERYTLTPSQVAALRSLMEGIVELSPTEVAVSGRLLPNQARHALAELEQLGLANSWIPVTGQTGDRVYELTDEGQMVSRALAQFSGAPPVGAVVRMPRSFATWRSRQAPSYVEVVPESPQATAM